jgi:glycosyltransferase involved in cell wall biosynthesis
MAIVTIVVPTYNRPDMLRIALLSIFAQTCKDFNIIVINDAGIDVQPIITEVDKEGRILYLPRHENCGVGAARNLGIGVAKSKYIAYLDDDAIYYPEHLETLLTFLENSAYKIAYTDANKAEHLPEEKICGQPNPISPIHCFMHERSCVETCRFNERILYGEDLDLWLRLSVNYRFAHIRKVTAEYRRRKTYFADVPISIASEFSAAKKIAQHEYSIATKTQRQLMPIFTKALVPEALSIAQKIAIEHIANEKRIKQGRHRVYKNNKV